MTIYEINAATVFSVAHDARLTEAERLALLARLLQIMNCDAAVPPEDVKR